MTRRWAGIALRALALAVCMVGSAATAAGWTIQTIALRDLREAEITAEDLRQFGLDAYTEFAMWEGEQFVRVRLGCFADRDSAEEMALRIRANLVADAVPVERTPGAPSGGCLEERTGFLYPAEWRQVADRVPAFEIAMADTVAVVRHDGRRWRVEQDAEALPLLSPQTPPRFRQADIFGVAVVEMLRPDGPVVVCPGRLLAEAGDVAIVDRGDRVVSCQLRSAATLVEAG